MLWVKSNLFTREANMYTIRPSSATAKDSLFLGEASWLQSKKRFAPTAPTATETASALSAAVTAARLVRMVSAPIFACPATVAVIAVSAKDAVFGRLRSRRF